MSAVTCTLLFISLFLFKNILGRHWGRGVWRYGDIAAELVKLFRESGQRVVSLVKS